MSPRAYTGNPFPGLRPFRADEEFLFFGREDQVDSMVDKLAATHFLGVLGTSGSGKSSLVNCGLRPALHQGLMTTAGTAWRVAVCRPGGNPIGAMARALAADGVLFRDFAQEGMSLTEIVETTLRMSKRGLVDIFEQAPLPANTNVLVVVDQFEELFRFRNADDRSSGGRGPSASEEASAFVNLLLEVKQRTDLRLYVVLTMRSDFIGDCTQFPGLAEAINEGQYLVPRMTRDNRRAAIRGPAGVSGTEMEPVLLTRLVNDVGDNPDQLSILQHALNRTWARWKAEGGEGPITLAHYEAIGTMEHALDQHAEQAYAELGSEEQRRVAEKLFRALTDKASDPRGIRRPTPFGVLCELVDAAPADVAAVIEVFRKPSRSFLMPPAGEPLEPASVVDISHETLMRVWRRLDTWAAAEAESARTYRRLAETAALHAAGSAGLWGDPDLELALDWRRKDHPNATWAARYDDGFDAAMDFLTASRDARDAAIAAEEERRRRELEAEREKAEEQARHARRMRVAALISGALAVAAVIAVFFANAKQKEARRHLGSSNLIAGRSEIADGRVARGLQAYWRAFESLPGDDPRRRGVRGLIASWLTRAGTLLPGEHPVYTVEISPDGRSVATLDAMGAVHLWDAATGAPREAAILHFDEDAELLQIVGIAYGAEGDLLATCDDEGTVRFWDTRTRERRGEPLKNELPVYGLRISPDGSLLAAGSEETVRVWDLKTRRPLVDLNPQGGVSDVQFSSDGQFIAVGSPNGMTRVWSLVSSEEAASSPAAPPKWELAVLVGEDEEPGFVDAPIESLAFSPGGALLATGSGDGEARMWDLESGALLCRIPHSDHVSDLAFSPDGSLLATACFDDAARLWSVVRAQQLAKADRLMEAARKLGRAEDFGALQQLADPMRGDKGLQVGRPLRHTDDLYRVVFSPDGKLLATAGGDSVARVWSVASGLLANEPLSHDSSIGDVVFSPDGHTLATASDDGTAGLWSLEHGERRGKPMVHVSPEGASLMVLSVAFSPDGATLATRDGYGTIRFWDVASQEPAGDLAEMVNAQANAFAYSPDGKWLVAGCGDGYPRAFERTDEGWKLRQALQRPADDDESGDDEDVDDEDVDDEDVDDEGVDDEDVDEDDGEMTWWAPVSAVSFSCDGSLLATASGGLITLWAHVDGLWQPRGPDMEGDDVVTLAFSPDGTLLASGGDDSTAQLWSVEEHEQVGETMRHRDTVATVAFAPDGKTLVTASYDNAVRVWSVEDQTLDGETMRHPDDVRGLALSPDGTIVATAGWDNVARLWDVSTRQPRGEIARHAGIVNSVAFSPDGRTFATASNDGTACLWHVVPPCVDDPERMRLSIEIATCTSLDDEDGIGRRLTIDELDERRDALEELGGPAFARSWDAVAPDDRPALESEAERVRADAR